MNYKNIRKSIFAFATCAAVLAQTVFAFAECKNWGLGFPTPGQQPVGNESADYLKQYDAYFMGGADKKVLYLTFDAGYEQGYTDKILDTLKQNNVPAAFFVVGSYIKTNPELVKRMVAEGHIVGNHTIKHPDMSTLGAEEISAQLAPVEEIFKQVTDTEMKKYYRPPMGKFNEQNLKAVQKLGYKTVFWSLAYKDYDKNQQPTKEMAFSKLIPRVHNGAVILLHNTSKTNAELLDELIKKYKDMGYEFKSLDDLTAE